MFCSFVIFFFDFCDFLYIAKVFFYDYMVCGFCFEVDECGLLSFSVRVLLFLFLQCALFDGVDLLDSEAQI